MNDVHLGACSHLGRMIVGCTTAMMRGLGEVHAHASAPPLLSEVCSMFGLARIDDCDSTVCHAWESDAQLASALDAGTVLEVEPIQCGATYSLSHGGSRCKNLAWTPVVHGTCVDKPLTVAEAAATLAGSQCYIGFDSGLMHLARAVGCPHHCLVNDKSIGLAMRWQRADGYIQSQADVDRVLSLPHK